jgi:cardiolipin synthase
VSHWFNAYVPRLTAHSLIVVVSLLTYVLTTRVERERRPPAIAIAWVLGLIAIPYLALPLYLLFGRRKLSRKPWPKDGSTTRGQHWADDLIMSFGLPAAAPATVRLHRDGTSARRALFEVVDAAQQRLDLCTYVLGNDALGRELIDRLIQRVQSGVRVRLLLDGVGALLLPRQTLRRLRAAGIETAVFSPLFARRTSGPRNLRNHRKLVIADDLLLWAGGRNLAAEYFIDRDGQPAWCDLSFDLHGPVAAAAAAQFEIDWRASKGRPAAPLAIAPTDNEANAAARAQFLPSGPDQTEDTVEAVLIDACYRAERRVLAVTPYFVPDANLHLALRLAARRGVRIDLCLPAKSNHVLADFARSRALRTLSEAGVAVHLLPFMLHAKGVVFDDSLALCGSPNLDSRSLLLNYESAFVLYGATEIRWLATWISDLIPLAVPFDTRPPPLWRDVAEGLLLTVAYQL